MIKSMTGYGRSEITGTYHWIVEIRSVNHRFLEVFVKLPKPWLFLEDRIKKHIKSKLSRGRIDVFVNFSSEELNPDIKIDKALASNYYKKLKELQKEIGFEGPISLSLLSMIPSILTVEEDFAAEQQLWETLVPVLDDALQGLIKMRIKEGENLCKDIRARLEIIKNKTDNIESRADLVPQEYKKRLSSTIKQHFGSTIISDERLEAEVAIFAERANITEELVRLKSHLKQMEELINSDESVGKKMDFIAQEMFREANTIASKASDYSISKEIIEIKSELEKIREQIQNIE